jgi:DNA-binding CsgD family transcriptional regulator
MDSSAAPLSPGPRDATAFVGRERELAFLTALLDPASDRQLSVVLISGEPGVGKTRLLAEAAAQAEATGWRVLLGRAYDSEGMPPYLPFIEALQDHVRVSEAETLRQQLGDTAAELLLILPEIRRHQPELPIAPSLDQKSERYRLFEAVAAFLQGIASSAPAGVMLCLDDLHWADDSTLLLLEHLVRRPPDARLFILASYRDTDLDVGRPLSRTLEQLARQRLYRRLDLRRLSEDEVRLMLAAQGPPGSPAPLVSAIYNETEGNPFFVREVFEYLREEGLLLDDAGRWRADVQMSELDVPQGVLLVVGRRLQRLSEACRNALAQASVIGRTFDFQLLLRLVDVDEETLLAAVEEAERAQLLESDAGGRLRFSHDLIRQTLLKGLSLARRQRIHQRIAAGLEALVAGRAEQHLGEIASHYRAAGAAGDPQKAVDYSVRAAEAAMSVFAWNEAVSHYDGAVQASELSGRGDESSHCDLLLALGRGLIAAGGTHRIMKEVGPQALTLAEALGDSQRAFAACRLAMEAVSDQTAQPWLDAAKRHIGDDVAARIEYNHRQSPRSLHEGRLLEAKELLLEGIELARQSGDTGAELRDASALLRFGLLTAAEEEKLLFEMSKVARSETSMFSATNIGLDAVMIHLQYGDRPAAEAERQGLARLARETRHDHAISSSAAAEALFLTLDGRLHEAVEATLAADRGTFPRVWRGRLAGWLGDKDALEALFAWNEGRTSYFAPGQTAVLLAHAGRLDEARALIAGVADLAPSPADGVISYNRTLLYLEAAAISGAKPAAQTLLELTNQEKRVLGKPLFALVPAQRARLAALIGDFHLARACYLEAIEFGERIGHRPELALARLGLAELLLSQDARSRDAQQNLELAIQELEAMQMAPALERALRLRERRPAAAEPRLPAYPDSLSEREVEVLRLVASGKSNKQIADELVISLNTVTHHVSNIFNKSGSTNRTEAAAYAHRTGLV